VSGIEEENSMEEKKKMQEEDYFTKDGLDKSLM